MTLPTIDLTQYEDEESVEDLKWLLDMQKSEMSRLRGERQELRDAQAASLRTIHSQEKQLRDAGLKTSAAARVFAIPELMEHILIQLELHTKEPFVTGNVSHAMQLCRLERVNHSFFATIRRSSKLKLPKEELKLAEIPTEHAAVIWLLRELGHSGFSAANCETFRCARVEQGRIIYDHRCSDAGIVVKHSPGYMDAVSCKTAFEEAKKTDTAWRSIRVAKPLLICFKDRSETYRYVTSYDSKLGELWDRHHSRL